MIKRTLLAVFVGAFIASPANAKPGNADNGAEVYAKRCVWCHGEEGDGYGPGAERMNPPPRDFTGGMYKIKTTGLDDMVPNDEDIYRMIKDGMPGTHMPGWSDIVSEQDMWDLTAYIKTFAGYEEETPETQVDYGKQVQSSPESLAKGKEIFIDLCAECHGTKGKGDAIKKLKGDNGERTWPRNLTKPWTFRGSTDPKDIYTRVVTGIPGTQMPSFADPASKKKLSSEEIWHVANYASSLTATGHAPNADKTVIQVNRVEGELPTETNDPRWDAIEPNTFFMLPQIIAKERFFTHSNDSVSVRAMFDDENLAMLLEWDDRTKSIPGDETAISIADEELFEDAIAVQLPITIPEGMEKPYFGMGDPSNPVNLWMWKSGTTEAHETVQYANATGFGNMEPRDAAGVGLTAKGSYSNGTWRVLMTRPLMTDDANDLQIEKGRFIPIAFSAWDGSNSETASKHTLSTWYWMLLVPKSGSKPLIVALLVALLIGAGELWWLKSAQSKKSEG
ncbi:MAG: c-type cytochrome [Magnetococcales bacterium]|nr:c-type cytochrome [Magnetococcales bacterium]